MCGSEFGEGAREVGGVVKAGRERWSARRSEHRKTVAAIVNSYVLEGFRVRLATYMVEYQLQRGWADRRPARSRKMMRAWDVYYD